MQYKPHLIKNTKNNTFTFIYIDSEKLHSKPMTFDNLEKAFSTKNSPIKHIYIKKIPSANDKKNI